MVLRWMSTNYCRTCSNRWLDPSRIVSHLAGRLDSFAAKRGVGLMGDGVCRVPVSASAAMTTQRPIPAVSSPGSLYVITGNYPKQHIETPGRKSRY